MVSPYQPIPAFQRERLAIAIMCGETMKLHWCDEDSGMAYYGEVRLCELIERDGRDYLVAETPDDEVVYIRLDLIRNLPTPVK